MTTKVRRALAGIAFAVMLALSMSATSGAAYAKPPVAQPITHTSGGGVTALGVTWED